MEENFKNRLETVMADRKITRWGVENGLNSGTTGRINQGHVPGADIQTLIMRIENVSTSWLMDKSGSPYLHHQVHSDEDGAAFLDELFAEDWKIYVLTCPLGQILVLTLPAQMAYKKEHIDYTAIEVLHGALGDRCRQVVKEHGPVLCQSIEPALYQRAIREGMGTFELLGDDNHPGLLDGAQACDEMPVIEREHCEELDQFYGLTEAQQANVLSIISDLAKSNQG
ncbi:MAG: hypothetical protein ACPGPD_13380 [Pseudomonadales bacterium]